MNDCDTATFGGADNDLGGFDDFDEGAASGETHIRTAALPCLPINRLKCGHPYMRCGAKALLCMCVCAYSTTALAI